MKKKYFSSFHQWSFVFLFFSIFCYCFFICALGYFSVFLHFETKYKISQSKVKSTLRRRSGRNDKTISIASLLKHQMYFLFHVLSRLWYFSIIQIDFGFWCVIKIGDPFQWWFLLQEGISFFCIMYFASYCLIRYLKPSSRFTYKKKYFDTFSI